MATGRNRNRARARARNRFRARGSRKKHWLSGAGTGIAAGALMGLMGDIIFFTSGLYAFQQGADAVGIGYMVLTAAFPVVMVTAGWWMGRGVGAAGETGRRTPGCCRRKGTGTTSA